MRLFAALGEPWVHFTVVQKLLMQNSVKSCRSECTPEHAVCLSLLYEGCPFSAILH